MRKASRKSLEKWDLAHLQELIETYVSDKYPIGKYRLLKKGSLIYYEIWPNWWARIRDRVETVTFLELVRDLYQVMTGNKSNNIGFADMYLEGIETEIIDVLYLLHIYAKANVNNNSTNYKQNNKEELEVDYSSPLIRLQDGNYRISAFPIYMKHKDGEMPDLDEIIHQIRKRFT